MHVPHATNVTLARFPEGRIVLLPAYRRVTADRALVGVTLRCSDLEAAEAALPDGTARRVKMDTGTSLFLPPERTHGIWIELFRPAQPGRASAERGHR